MVDASHVIGLFPDLLPQEYRNGIYYPGPIPEFRGVDLENGLSALVIYLTNVRPNKIIEVYSKGKYFSQ